MNPKPLHDLPLKLKKLWKIHFEKRNKSEEKYFKFSNNYENKISNILRVNNELELNGAKVLDFVKSCKSEICFLTGVPILKDPFFFLNIQ